jgi:hypothetical protein
MQGFTVLAARRSAVIVVLAERKVPDGLVVFVQSVFPGRH